MKPSDGVCRLNTVPAPKLSPNPIMVAMLKKALCGARRMRARTANTSPAIPTYSGDHSVIKPGNSI